MNQVRSVTDSFLFVLEVDKRVYLNKIIIASIYRKALQWTQRQKKNK